MIPESVKVIASNAFESSPKVSVRAYQGSEAERFANSNGLKLKTIKRPLIASNWDWRVFLVAADEYDAPNSSLQYTKNDALALCNAFDKLGVPKKNITLLTSSGDSNGGAATSENIKEQFEAFVSKLSEGSVAFVYFAGHGFSKLKNGSETKDVNEFKEEYYESFFAPKDYSVKQINIDNEVKEIKEDGQDEEVGKPLSVVDDLLKPLSDSKASFKWLCIDACRSDPNNQSDKNGRAFTKSIGDASIDAMLSPEPPKGCLLMQSCSLGQFAEENQIYGHGLFSYALLDILTGACDDMLDGDQDGAVSLREIREYLVKFVGENAQETNKLRFLSSQDAELEIRQKPTFSVSEVKDKEDFWKEAILSFNKPIEPTPPGGDAGETPDATYSNSILNRSLNQNIGLAFMYQNEKLRAQLGASAIPTSTYNKTNDREYNPGVIWNFSPRAMLFYDFTDNSNVRLFYWGRSSQPSTSQLMPVADNSNPLSVSLGNPYLRPYFGHGLRSDLEFSNKKTFFTMRLHVEGDYTRTPIVSAIWYDLAGRTFSLPVNGEDSYSANMRLMINAPIAKSNFSISNMLRLSYSKSGSYIGAASLDMSEYYDETTAVFQYANFHNNYFDESGKQNEKWAADFLNNSTRSLGFTERLRATYRSDDVEVMLSGRTRMSKPWYTVQAAVAATWANQVSASFKWTVGQSGFEISTDADYNWYRGYTTEQPSEFVWNASVSQQVFKRRGTISLKAYDILDQAKNLTVTDTANYHQEVRNNTLGRYIMLSFTWRFGNFGRAGQQMRARGGMGGPGGRRPF